MRAWLVLLAALGVTAACASGPAGSSPSADVARRIAPPADIAPLRRDPALAYRPASGALASAGATFRSRVTDLGVVEVTPRRAPSTTPPFAPAEGTPLTVETLSVLRGSRVVAAGGSASVTPDGSVAIRRGEILERIENAAVGVEQSWIFERAPRGDGDLVVRLRAGGETYVRSTDHGLHFDGAGLGIRYGTATWVDARGARTTVTPRFVDGEIVLTVPEGVLADSAYPAVLDPVITAEREVDSPVGVDSAPGDQYYPTVTAMPGGGYFAVWHDRRSIRPAFFGAHITSSGQVTDATGIAVASGVAASQPFVVSSTAGFLLVWAVAYYDAHQAPGVYALRLDPAGKPLDAGPVPLTAPNVNQNRAKAAFDGTNWLVVWDLYGGASSNDVVGVRLPAAGGAPLDTTPIPIAADATAEQDASVVYDGTSFFVTYRTAAGLVGRRVGTDGKVLDAVTLVANASMVDYSLASNGTTHLVAYDAYNGSTGAYDVLAERFDASGASLSGGIPTVMSGSSGGYSDHPRATWDSAHFLVVWERSGAIEGARIAADGALVDATPAMLASTPYAYEVAAASDGKGGLVVYREYSSTSASDVHAAFVSTAAGLSGGTPVTVSKAANSETEPATAWNGQTHLTTWLDTREPQPTIWAAPVGVDGTPGKPNKIVPNPAGAPLYYQLYGPRIASNGASFYVTFAAYDSGTGRQTIFGVAVDAQGVPLGAITPISSAQSGGFLANVGSPDLAWDGASYLVVWEEQSADGVGIVGRRIGPDGAPLDEKFLRLSPTNPGSERRSASIAFDGQRYFVAWATTRPTIGNSGIQVSHIYGTRVEKDGTPLDGELLVCSAFLLQNAPRVAGDRKNGGFFVVWEDYRTSLETADVYGARIDADGHVLDGDKGRPISTGDGDESHPSVSASGDGTNWIVVWRDLRSKQTYDVYGAWVSIAGTNHDPNGLLLSAEGGDEESPAIDGSGAGKLLLTYSRLDQQTGYGSYRLRARAIEMGKPVAETCENADDCASRNCVDGFCCATECDGCGTCSVTPGTCQPRPAGSESPRCLNRCTGTLECPSECKDNADCVNGSTCDRATKKCVTRQACIDDKTLQDLTGKQTDCAPYTCVGDACRTTCGSVDDCADGFVCDPSGRCIPPPSGADFGACSASRAPSPASGDNGTSAVVALASALLVVGTRRRRSG